jgi:hypothetical protein
MNDRREYAPDPTQARLFSTELAPPDYRDPVVEVYKKDVDCTLLRENLKLTVEQRLRKADLLHASLAGWREAGKHLAAAGPKPA